VRTENAEQASSEDNSSAFFPSEGEKDQGEDAFPESFTENNPENSESKAEKEYSAESQQAGYDNQRAGGDGNSSDGDANGSSGEYAIESRDEAGGSGNAGGFRAGRADADGDRMPGCREY